MSWQLIHLADVPPAPWRNGGGVTRELIAWPQPQAWTWRVSVAEVASSGPFSHFDGVQRWLAILRGAGVRLDFAGRSVELTERSAPLPFAGSEAVDCQLLGGAVQDLNLMLRTDAAQGALTGRMLRVAGAMRVLLAAPATVAIYSPAAPARVHLAGLAVVVPAQCLAWRALPAGAEVEIEASNAIWMEIG